MGLTRLTKSLSRVLLDVVDGGGTLVHRDPWSSVACLNLEP
jgi:hypothetical protein